MSSFRLVRHWQGLFDLLFWAECSLFWLRITTVPSLANVFFLSLLRGRAEGTEQFESQLPNPPTHLLHPPYLQTFPLCDNIVSFTYSSGFFQQAGHQHTKRSKSPDLPFTTSDRSGLLLSRWLQRRLRSARSHRAQDTHQSSFHWCNTGVPQSLRSLVWARRGASDAQRYLPMWAGPSSHFVCCDGKDAEINVMGISHQLQQFTKTMIPERSKADPGEGQR